MRTPPATWSHFIQCFGSYGRHPLGLTARYAGPNWASNMLESMELFATTLGYVHLDLMLPGGHRDVAREGRGPMPWDQWRRLGRLGRQAKMADLLTDWQTRRPHTILGLYTGMPPSWRAFYGELVPWVRECGIRRFIFDMASSPTNNDLTLAIHDALAQSGIEVIGESVPADEDYRKRGLWMALARDHAQHDPDGTWGSNIGIGIGSHPLRTDRTWRFTPKDAAKHFRRGQPAFVYGDGVQHHQIAMAGLHLVSMTPNGER